MRSSPAGAIVVWVILGPRRRSRGNEPHHKLRLVHDREHKRQMRKEGDSLRVQEQLRKNRKALPTICLDQAWQTPNHESI
jgi:hypothetical protein